MEHSKPSLFQLANNYFLEQNYLKAWGIYTYLSYLNDWDDYKAYRSRCEPYIPARYCRIDFDLQKSQLLAAHLLAEDQQASVLESLIKENNPYLAHAEYALVMLNLYRNDQRKWLNYLNQYLMLHQCIPLKYQFNKTHSHENCLAHLSVDPTQQVDTDTRVKTNQNDTKPLSTKDQPLVTIAVSSFNSSTTIEYALQSLLKQTYQNIEIIVVDDNSTDNSCEVIERIAATDQRIQVLCNQSNQGTYINRNRIFKSAKGKYFTILDADDYALPDRIEAQVTLLEENEQYLATHSNWIRLSPEGKAHFKLWTGRYSHDSVATLMMRTQAIRERIGFWDSVRIAADTEYLHRIHRVFGKERVYFMQRPTTFALYHEQSLTRCKQTGISEEEGLSPVRVNYRVAWKQWHSSVANDEALFLDFPLQQRPFQLPNGMPIGGEQSA
ncbi:MAG: glycosyltransferase family 2 protein [bacterium]